MDRRVEITGPTERKMAINALNSGAKVWLADLEDANTPHWRTSIGGQVNLVRRGPPDDLLRRAGRARQYALDDGEPADHRDAAARLAPARAAPAASTATRRSARWSTSGCYFFHNAAELLARGCGPYFYLPKMESHLEARLWNDVFAHAQERARASRPARSGPPC